MLLHILHAAAAVVSPTWANRLGLTVTPIATGVWAAERTSKRGGIDIGARTIMTRTQEGTLAVHTPCELDEALKDAIATIGGGVGYIIGSGSVRDEE